MHHHHHTSSFLLYNRQRRAPALHHHPPPRSKKEDTASETFTGVCSCVYKGMRRIDTVGWEWNREEGTTSSTRPRQHWKANAPALFPALISSSSQRGMLSCWYVRCMHAWGLLTVCFVRRRLLFSPEIDVSGRWDAVYVCGSDREEGCQHLACV